MAAEMRAHALSTTGGTGNPSGGWLARRMRLCSARHRTSASCGQKLPRSTRIAQQANARRAAPTAPTARSSASSLGVCVSDSQACAIASTSDRAR
eukprot:scaffold1394_cov109-Isochrysis_galbana.AAC.25